MILGQQEASKILPLVTNLDTYDAFLVLLACLHKEAYEEAKFLGMAAETQRAIGKLILIDELKELRERLKDSLKRD